MENKSHSSNPSESVEKTAQSEKAIASKLDTIGWGAFFIWIGIAFLLDLGFGVGLLGVGAITLLEQAARVYYKIKLEMFWLVAGLVFLLGGLWDMFEPDLPFLPILLIIAGLVMLGTVLIKRN